MSESAGRSVVLEDGFEGREEVSWQDEWPDHLTGEEFERYLFRFERPEISPEREAERADRDTTNLILLGPVRLLKKYWRTVISISPVLKEMNGMGTLRPALLRSLRILTSGTTMV